MTPFTETPELLAPLLEGGPYGNFRNDLALVSGLSYSLLENHALGSHGHATCVFSGYRSVADPALPAEPLAGGPTVDQLAAAGLGRGEALVLQLRNGGDHWKWSHRAARTQSTFYELPSRLWADLFRVTGLGAMEQEQLRRREKSVLDFVKADAERLRKRLGKSDRARLDEHLSTVRSIEASLATPTGSCDSGAQPMDGYGHFTGTLYGDFEAYTKTMIRLGVLALQCDLRRSLFISLGASQNDDGRYTHLDPAFRHSIHTVQHGANNISSSTDAEANRQYRAIARWHQEMFAYTLSLLKAPTSAGGSLLSNSVVVSTSEFSDGGGHIGHFMPVLVAGQARPLRTGVHVAYRSTDAITNRGTPCNGQMVHGFSPSWSRTLPGRENRCLSDLWQTCLESLGVWSGTERFGDTGLWQPSRLSELWS